MCQKILLKKLSRRIYCNGQQKRVHVCRRTGSRYILHGYWYTKDKYGLFIAWKKKWHKGETRLKQIYTIE